MTVEAIWCKHMDDLEPHNWNFCPICGTPKPESKSLAEELYLAWMGDAIPAYEWDDSEMSEERIDWQRVADKAREIIE